MLINSMNTGSQGRFTLGEVENHTARGYRITLFGCDLIHIWHLDYPRTLREWDRRFEVRVTQDLLVMHSASDAEYEILKRKWRYLFNYASAGFAKGWIKCHMITFTRQVNLIVCGLLREFWHPQFIGWHSRLLWHIYRQSGWGYKWMVNADYIYIYIFIMQHSYQYQNTKK